MRIPHIPLPAKVGGAVVGAGAMLALGLGAAGPAMAASAAPACTGSSCATVTVTINEAESMIVATPTITFPALNVPGATYALAGTDVNPITALPPIATGATLPGAQTAEVVQVNNNNAVGYNLALTPSGSAFSSIQGGTTFTIPNGYLAVLSSLNGAAQTTDQFDNSGLATVAGGGNGPSLQNGDEYQEQWRMTTPSGVNVASGANYSETFTYTLQG